MPYPSQAATGDSVAATREPARLCIVDARPEDYRALHRPGSACHLPSQLVSSGREALALAGRGSPGIWVVNVELPDMRGLDVCEMLRHGDRRNVVIAVTDRYRPEDERAAWIRGAAMFRPKPVDAQWFRDVTAACRKRLLAA